MESAFGGRASSLAPSKFLNAPTKLSSHTSAFNAGAVVTSSASWCKKPSFHASIGLGWPYWFCGSWYGSHIAYYFSLAWWEPYACYPWYASWNPYPYNGWSYWYAPWIYKPLVAPVYYCDYYTAPTVIHTTQVVHEVVHVETSDDNYTKKYSAAPVKEAADPAEELKKLTPSEQFQRLGDIHFREGRYDQAAIAYERAIAENPDHAALRFILADARFAMGDFHGAASAIRQGLAKDPGLAKAKADKLAFYEKPEAFEKQLGALRAYAGEHPADADAQLVLGFNLLFSGKEDEAREVFRKAKAIDAEDAAATLFLEALKK